MKALKEWGSVIRALECGDQTVLLRKGGILETASGFRTEADRFLLYPTAEHQGSANIRERFHGYLEGAPPKDAGGSSVTSYASVLAEADISSRDVVERLSGFHIWSDSYVGSRMAWQAERPIRALFLRVFRVPGINVPPKPEYAGCKSWIDVECTVPGGEPALDDTRVESLLEEFRRITG